MHARNIWRGEVKLVQLSFIVRRCNIRIYIESCVPTLPSLYFVNCGGCLLVAYILSVVALSFPPDQIIFDAAFLSLSLPIHIYTSPLALGNFTDFWRCSDRLSPTYLLHCSSILITAWTRHGKWILVSLYHRAYFSIKYQTIHRRTRLWIVHCPFGNFTSS